ncbi:MAG: hypothetical protein BroJett003_24350 [Planctomycetota bacterium]|nr:MAG: hypothetical protein BroJett003_24350 [Planctomycetota bacterium]
MVVKTVNSAGELENEYLAVRYGATPQDWEEAADETHFVELIDGRLIMHSPAGLAHQRTFGFLHHLLRSFVEQRKLGEVLTGPFTMDLALERKLEPDLIFVTSKTVANLTEDRLIGPADLAIEIASASTRSYDRGEKRECYRVGRVAEYIMIDAFSKLVTLDRPAGREILSLQEGWIASESCKGFAFRAEWLWTDPLPDVERCLGELEPWKG